MKILLVIRGAPGSGKSTIAWSLVKAGWFYTVVEADQYFYLETGSYKFKPELLPQAHAFCLHNAERMMKEDCNIIVSNTSVRNQDVTPYLELADKYGYIVQEMILWNAPFKNVHGVPEDKVQQKLNTLHNQFK